MAVNYKRLEEITSSLKQSRQDGKNFHATFVYHGSKMICIGTNSYNKQNLPYKFGDYQSNRSAGTYNACLHSEVSSLIRLGMEDCHHLTFINIRVNNLGQPAISKPCVNCMRNLKSVGFKYLYYFDGEKYVKEKY
jgi:hypothetical protein